MAGRHPERPSHAVIPDTQHTLSMDSSHLHAAGRYILEKRPNTIIHLGDIGDFSSLSSYDSAAAKGFDQRDFGHDCEAAMLCADILTRAVRKHNKTHPRRRQYHPRWVLLEGNHDGQTGEGRIARAARDTPWLRTVLTGQLNYERFGWEVVPFLQPIIIDGVSYCHFFCRNSKGSVLQTRNGQPSAHQQVLREGMSATAGHKQGLDVHIQPVGDGSRRRGIIAGSFYQGTMVTKYLSPQGQHHWRGMLMKHELRGGGDYDLTEVSLQWLLRRWS